MNIEVRVVIMDSKLELFLSKLNLPKEDYNYFNSMIEAFESKNTEEDKIIDSSFKNKCTYVIRPNFILSKETDMSAFEKELVDNYSISSLMGYDNGIIRENKRSMGKCSFIYGTPREGRSMTLFFRKKFTKPRRLL